MSLWIPIIKVVLPYVGPIVSAALPSFTKKKAEGSDPVLAQQIAELQEAVKANAESARALARAAEEAASAYDTAIRQARRIAFAASGVAAVSLVVAVAALLN